MNFRAKSSAPTSSSFSSRPCSSWSATTLRSRTTTTTMTTTITTTTTPTTTTTTIIRPAPPPKNSSSRYLTRPASPSVTHSTSRVSPCSSGWLCSASTSSGLSLTSELRQSKKDAAKNW